MRALVLLSLVALASCKIVFDERFDADWRSRWVDSTFKSGEQGKFELSAGKFYGDAEKDKGLKTSQDARFYGISAKFAAPVSTDGKTLVVQFTVKHEQSIDCGGGYIKVYPSDVDQKNLHGDSPYLIMFGPDICGYSTKKVHVIFNYKGKNMLIKKEIKCKDDVFTHLYTLIVRSDNTYEVRIDEEKVESGTLEDDWDFLAPKKIKDPAAKKPEDWDDHEEIDDATDTKPAEWDKPQYIPDPNAKKPDDWDDEMDGKWEPPQIDNPEFKGEWKPKKIKNPAYKGVWIHPEIDNPEYAPDSNLYRYTDVGAVGFDLWQVKSGTIFDNVLVAVGEGTEPVDEASKQAEETWKKTKEPEKKMKDKQDEEERKQREEEEKQRKEQEEKEKKEKGETETEKEEDEKEEEKEKEEPKHEHDHQHGDEL